jgi:hypothetical protein
MESLSPSPWVRRLPTSDGLLLIDNSTNRLLAYNNSAFEVWKRLTHRLTLDVLVADFAAQFGIPVEVARPDVHALLTQWRDLGMIGTGISSEPPLTTDTFTNKGPDWMPRPVWAVQRTFTIRGISFAFAAESPSFVAFADIFLRHLETPDAKPSVQLHLRSTADGQTAVVVDNVEQMRSRDGGQLIGGINQAILEHLHPGIEWMAMIHGAAVARCGVGIALPAACGSGKTTLTAFLLARGYDYLADDLIALAAPDGRIVPWPMPISIKEGSWKLLTESYHDLNGFPQYRTMRGRARQLVPSLRVWETEAVPFGSFVFPSYVPDAEPVLTPITTFDALCRLLGDHIWFGYPIVEQRVLRFLAWLDQKPAYALVHGSVADAARLIEDMA